MKSWKIKVSILLLNFAFITGVSFPCKPLPNQSPSTEPIEVAEILKAASEYCKKLENAALYFVCKEEITEKINFTKDIALSRIRLPRRNWSRMRGFLQKIKNNYVYDYQFIREKSQITETRTLLQENRKKKKVKDAPLKTQSFQFKNVIMGPVGILSQRWQFSYDYKFVGVEQVNGLPAVVLDITPKQGFQTEFLFGKVWINKNNHEILKIEWSPQRIGDFALFERRGQRYKSEPRITLISEFQVTKNGIRFPSHFYIEEAYISKKGKKFIRSETTVVYTDFKFFTVEIEVMH